MRGPSVRAGVVAGFVLASLGMLAGNRTWAPRPFAAIEARHTLEASTSVPTDVSDVLHRACYDCHSANTKWPWYARLPPGSWIVTYDVNAGRGQLDFSQWGAYNPYDRADLLDKICDLTKRQKMPVWQYRLMHHEARLSDADVRALCGWAEAEASRLVGGS